MVKKAGFFMLIFIAVAAAFFLYEIRKTGNGSYTAPETTDTAQSVASGASVEIPVMKVGEATVYYPEFEFYLLATKKDYEVLAGTELWDMEKDGKPALELLKIAITEEIARLKIVVSEARKQGYEISAEEEEEIRNTAREQLEGIDPVIKARYYLDEELISKIYMENFLATKFFGGYSKKLGLTGESAKVRFNWKYEGWEKNYRAEIYWENINKMSVGRH